ncbi:NACHT domain-containing protein [Burkholderia cenocepacia]|uniref:NACHT domain-containing protein n=1 Tax=Burkholderia cenocepacia TaxID=95486 RepID=UPI00158C9C6F|nr:hypothetical protein [Burkholderia cenocepacia]
MATTSDAQLAGLRSRIIAAQRDPSTVVREYVSGLDRLIAWDTVAFDAALSSSWKAILEIAEKYFRVESLVREHPRAQFDRSSYVRAHRNFDVVVQPRIIGASIPDGFMLRSASDPRDGVPPRLQALASVEELARIEPGALVILTGDGGIGKSTTLELIRALTLNERGESTLPIVVTLSKYDSNWLDNAINRELGILSGSWATLPDRILILCDGLNECSTDDASSFLKDLHLLLRNKRIACILAARNLSKHVTLTLPCLPVACVELLPLSPSGIRKIARAELGSQTQSVERFVEAYDALLTRSSGVHLRTPFAVLAAVKIWRTNSALPDTLGAMLQELLRQRCLRETESVRSGISPKVILSLAGALAFDALIRQGRLDWPAASAGRWISDAKERYRDAFGISDMRSNEVVELLKQHELLRQSAEGDFRFEHQMTAGALAAPMLATMWRTSLDALHNPVADDAWVFAAPLVAREELQQFLRHVFEVDILLGASVARECAVQDRMVSERLLIEIIESDVSEKIRSHALLALALLQTPNALAKIREISNGTTKSQIFAQRALASLGDEDFLRDRLKMIDKLRSAPFTVSGGTFDILTYAPISVRVKLARVRLRTEDPGSFVVESLRIVGYEEDPNDVELIERHLCDNANPKTWSHALRILQKIAPVRAQHMYEQSLSQCLDVPKRCRIIHIGALVGIEVDISIALNCVASYYVPSDNEFEASSIIENIIEDVLGSNLSVDQVVDLIECLKKSEGERRRRLWLLANHYAENSLADYALDCIGEHDSETCFGCWYFLAQPDTIPARRIDLASRLKAFLDEDVRWYTPARIAALSIAADVGLATELAPSLTILSDGFTQARMAIASGNPDTPIGLDIPYFDVRDSSAALYQLGRYVAVYLDVFKKYRSQLSVEVLLSFLHFDLRTFSGAVALMQALVSGVEDNTLDSALESIERGTSLVCALCVASTRPLTLRRIGLVETALTFSYGNAALMHSLTDCLRSCWTVDIVEPIVRVVTKLDGWPEHAEVVFRDFTVLVGERLSQNHVHLLETSIVKAMAPFGEQVLRIWLDYASKQRIGIPILPSLCEKSK